MSRASGGARGRKRHVGVPGTMDKVNGETSYIGGRELAVTTGDSRLSAGHERGANTLDALSVLADRDVRAGRGREWQFVVPPGKAQRGENRCQASGCFDCCGDCVRAAQGAVGGRSRERGETRYFWPESAGSLASGPEVREHLGLELVLTSLLAVCAVSRQRSGPLPGQHMHLPAAEIGEVMHTAASEVSFSKDRVIEESLRPVDARDMEKFANLVSGFVHELASCSEHASMYGQNYATFKAIQPGKAVAARLRALKTRPKHAIAGHETLVSIAEDYYHDANVSWLIADLNSLRVKESWLDDKRIVEIAERTHLELPMFEDLQKFYDKDGAGTLSERLITIVTVRQIDRVFVEEFLGKVVGHAARVTNLPA